MSLCAQPAAVNLPSVLATSYRERFGDEAADYGCASIPHVVVKHHRRLDMTYGEWDLITQLFSFKWTQADPYPSIPTLAERLAISARQVHALMTSAQQKGFLRVVPRPGHSNAYDLAPVIEKATQLEAMQRQGVQKTSTAPPLKTSTAPPLKTSTRTPPENQQTKKKQVPRKNGIERSVPPTPVAPVIEPPTTMDAEARPQARFDADYSALVDPLTAIGDELGDQAHPLASVTRAYKLMTAAQLDAGAFLALVEEARLHTLSAIQAQRRSKPPKPVDKPMAYYFGVLARLCQPEMYPPLWRTGPPRTRPAATPTAVPPSSPPSDLWEAVTAEAREIMTAENIARWFRTAHQLDHAGDVLTVAVPDAFHAMWLERMRRQVERAAASVQPGLQIAYVVHG